MRRFIATAGVFGTAATLLLFGADPASAHEVRTVGAYRFTVGFGNEPAYLGQENFVQFLLATRSGKAVTDLGNGLKVDVEVGNQRKTLALEPSFDADTGLGTRGEYDAFFFPTTVGKYTIHFHGSIHGQKVDESFTSGPETFSEVESPQSVEFPTKVPTTADISGLLSREIPRLTAAIADARDKADSSRLLGVIGIVVGAVGLGAGATALFRRRRS